MNPNELAAGQEIDQSYLGKRIAGKAIGLGLSAAGAYTGIKRILPLLNKAVPTALAAKGLSKIDPRLGEFFKLLFSNGYNIDQGVDFLREKIGDQKPVEQTNAPPQEAVGNMVQSVQGQNQPAQSASEKTRQDALQTFNGKVKESNMREDLMKRYSDTYGQPAQTEQSQGSNPQDAAIMAALQKILNM